jgi:hypothetical protein
MSVWEVVGGAANGGILVRSGQATSSSQLAERLATGALVEEISLVGERLNFRLLTGSGPQEGWVSLKAGGKDLLVKANAEPKPSSSALVPRCLLPARDVAPKFLACPLTPPLKKYMNKKKFLEAASKRTKGDLYGMLFPQTPQELNSDQFGAKFLTEAFHKAGSLSKDNSIVRIASCTPFDGGGSGPKAIIEVEYSKSDDSLDTKLFIKMPHPLAEEENLRFVQNGQAKFGDNWGGELSFYRFLSPHIPYAVPKFYFGDICRETTDSILINACVDWPAKDKVDFSAYEVMPPCGKCEDYTLTNPQDYYFAIMRRMGTFSGLAKADKLGPDKSKIQWYDCTPQNDVNCAPGFDGTNKNVRAFIEDIAPHWFPDKAKTPAFLDMMVTKTGEVFKHQMAIAKFLYEDPLYVGLSHQNGNTDNCYFFKREDSSVDAGVLDWGSTCHMAYATSFMGAVISGLAEMLAEYDERLIEAWLDAYHETGAARLDKKELMLRYRLATCQSAYGIMSFSNSKNNPETKAALKGLSGYNCAEIRSSFQWKFEFSMLYNRIMLFVLKGEKYWSAIEEMWHGELLIRLWEREKSLDLRLRHCSRKINDLSVQDSSFIAVTYIEP